MPTTRRSAFIWGVATAAATSAGLLWQRRRRLALASQAGKLAQATVNDLDVRAERTLLPGSGVQLHTVLAGPPDGRLVLLLHGFPDCWYGWHHQIPALARAGYRVAVPDQRGYNLSEKPAGVEAYKVDLLTADVAALIRALGHERAAIVGHDWGGFVAWRLAMDYPHLVEQLAILNAPHPRAVARALKGRDWAQALRSWYIALFQLPWLADALFGFSPRATARFVFRAYGARRDAFTEEDLEILAAALAQPGAMTAMIHWYRASFRYPPARRGADIHAPTLVLWGEEDPALGKELTYGLEKWVPDLRLHYLPHVGHWVQSEAAGDVNDHLLTFLEEPRT
ncbi:MAG: alpha/beta hydrolase [Anaerolineae bacterium]|nr:alpha/beta hydrolase [Anaerolineae bacterium]